MNRFTLAQSQRNFATLVLAEHFEGKLNANLGSMLSAAKQLNDPQVDVLVHGNESSVASQLAEVQKYPNINKVLVAKSEDLHNPYGDAIARVAKDIVKAQNYTNVVAASSGFGKDVVPRMGGHLDVQPITDVINVIDNGEKFQRPVYAGNAVATVSTEDKIKVLTIRATNFEKVEQAEASHDYPTEDVKVELDAVHGKWL